MSKFLETGVPSGTPVGRGDSQSVQKIITVNDTTKQINLRNHQQGAANVFALRGSSGALNGDVGMWCVMECVH